MGKAVIGGPGSGFVTTEGGDPNNPSPYFNYRPGTTLPGNELPFSLSRLRENSQTFGDTIPYQFFGDESFYRAPGNLSNALVAEIMQSLKGGTAGATTPGIAAGLARMNARSTPTYGSNVGDSRAMLNESLQKNVAGTGRDVAMQDVTRIPALLSTLAGIYGTGGTEIGQYLTQMAKAKGLRDELLFGLRDIQKKAISSSVPVLGGIMGGFFGG